MLMISARAARSFESEPVTLATICCRASLRSRRPPATSKGLKQERAALLKKEANERATAEAQAQQMSSLVLEFKRKAGEQGALYGSVTSMDIAEALKERGYEIDRHRIHLREPLKRLGDYTVPLRLHREVTIDLQVKVAPEGEVIVGHLTPEQEAELAKQAEGERRKKLQMLQSNAALSQMNT